MYCEVLCTFYIICKPVDIRKYLHVNTEHPNSLCSTRKNNSLLIPHNWNADSRWLLQRIKKSPKSDTHPEEPFSTIWENNNIKKMALRGKKERKNEKLLWEDDDNRSACLMEKMKAAPILEGKPEVLDSGASCAGRRLHCHQDFRMGRD